MYSFKMYSFNVCQIKEVVNQIDLRSVEGFVGLSVFGFSAPSHLRVSAPARVCQ
jgi:hypothetical protein